MKRLQRLPQQEKEIAEGKTTPMFDESGEFTEWQSIRDHPIFLAVLLGLTGRSTPKGTTGLQAVACESLSSKPPL